MHEEEEPEELEEIKTSLLRTQTSEKWFSPEIGHVCIRERIDIPSELMLLLRHLTIRPIAAISPSPACYSAQTNMWT